MQNLYNDNSKANTDYIKKNSRKINKAIYPFRQYINNGKKLNNFSNNREVLKIHEIIDNSNSFKNSFRKPYIFIPNYQNNNNTFHECNNHLLFDSNKQKIINPENNHHYAQFISNNKRKYNNYTSINKKSLYEKFLNDKNNKKYEDKYEQRINHIKNYTRNNTNNSLKNNTLNNHRTIQNYKISYYNFTHRKDSTQDKTINKSFNKSKYYGHIKVPSIQNRNKYFYNISNNYTEVSSNDYSADQSQSTNKNKDILYLKRNMTENNYINESNKKYKKIPNNRIYKEKSPTSVIMTETYKSPENNNYNYNKTNIQSIVENQTCRNINKNKLLIPIKLNIEDTNTEKLSRIKRIIEKSSTNHNFYQLELEKNNIGNKTIKSADKKNNKKNDEMDAKYIFKKKKIMLLKEKSKDGIHFENNFLVTSSTNRKKIKNHKYCLTLDNKIKDNNKIQSSVASVNLFIDKENNNGNLYKNENQINIKEDNKLPKIFKKKNEYQKNNTYINNNFNNNITDNNIITYSNNIINNITYNNNINNNITYSNNINKNNNNNNNNNINNNNNNNNSNNNKSNNNNNNNSNINNDNNNINNNNNNNNNFSNNNINNNNINNNNNSNKNGNNNIRNINNNNNNNINNDDTITLSYSKEQSLLSKNKKNEERSIILPFFVEQFSIYYNKYIKKLVITEKTNFNENKYNKKNNNISIESEDDNYLLTKEIILLKKGLAKKSELTKDIIKQLRELRPEKISQISLFGNTSKKIYKKKTSNFKIYRF